MLLTAHVRWLQTGPTYNGNVGVARFPDFSPHEKARNLVRNLFRPLPLLQKGLYRRGQLFGIDGFLRAPPQRRTRTSMPIRFGGGGTLLAIGSAGFRV